jgi:hypothetical protein
MVISAPGIVNSRAVMGGAMLYCGDEALCSGWIDSTLRRVDTLRFAQLFSPRKPGSPYSQASQERLRRLLAAHKVIESVRAGLGKVLRERFVVPSDNRLPFASLLKLPPLKFVWSCTNY